MGCTTPSKWEWTPSNTASISLTAIQDDGGTRHLLRSHNLCRRVCRRRPCPSGSACVGRHDQPSRADIKRALAAGVKIAFGIDAGGFDWKIDPAKEFALTVKYGITPAES